MSIFIEENQNEQIVSDILREIGKLNPYGLYLYLSPLYSCRLLNSSSDMSHDSTAAKNIGAFITDLATEYPKLVLSVISVLLPLLDGEVSILDRLVCEKLLDTNSLVLFIEKWCCPCDWTIDLQRTVR